MSKRYKCKKCSNREAVVTPYQESIIDAYVNFHCMVCDKWVDFKASKDTKECPICGLVIPRFEYQHNEVINARV